jgi:hypothetical protein
VIYYVTTAGRKNGGNTLPKKQRLERGEKMERVLVFGDHQVPYHDPRANGLLLDFARYETDEGRGFDKVIDVGDHWDAHQFTTKFAKEPGAIASIRRDKGMVAGHYRELEKVLPGVPKVWIEGNHEARLFSFLRDKAPEILMLFTEEGEDVDVPSILGIDSPNLEYIAPYGEVHRHKFGKSGDFIFKHGDKHGLYPAQKELQSVGNSGMSGHNHRLQVHTNTQEAGHQKAWFSIPAMCNIRGKNCPPGYMKGSLYRNWNQGFCDIWFSKERNAFEVNTHLIEEGVMVANGRLFKDVRGK